MSDGLTFYGLVADLRNLQDQQARIQVEIMKLGRTYTGLPHDERFQRIETRLSASLADLQKIIDQYDQKNREAETNLSYEEAQRRHLCPYCLQPGSLAVAQHHTTVGDDNAYQCSNNHVFYVKRSLEEGM